MASMHFIGLDIHKKAIRDCIKGPHGTVLREGSVAATRQDLDVWMKSKHSAFRWAKSASSPKAISATAPDRLLFSFIY